MFKADINNLPKESPNFRKMVFLVLFVGIVILVVIGILANRVYFNQESTSKKPSSPVKSSVLYPTKASSSTGQKQLPAQPVGDGQKNPPTKNVVITPNGSFSTLENTKIVYRFSYPTDWSVKGAVVATEFQASSDECQSVEVSDGVYGTGAAGGGVVVNNHAGVQVCAKSFNDGLTLDQFMQNIYKENLSRWFTKTTLNGVQAYQSNLASGVPNTYGKIIFLQTEKYRLQIDSFVVTTPDKQAERTTQVEDILHSFSLI